MIEKFIEENIEKKINNFTSFMEIRKRYLAFCKFYEIEPVSKRKLSHELGKYKVGVRGTKTIDYSPITGRHNIGLLPCKY